MRFLFAILAVVAITAQAEARITRVVIEHKDSPAYQGQSFGEAGRYEWLRGHAYGELDPKDPLNTVITDLQFAPRNARGFVEYTATFTLAKPIDNAKASGVMLYDVANRGRIALAGSSTNAGALADFFKRGDVVLSSGWQGDIPARDGIETIAVPVAKNPDGSSITGPVLIRFSDMMRDATTLPLMRGLGAGFPAPAPRISGKVVASRIISLKRISTGPVMLDPSGFFATGTAMVSMPSRAGMSPCQPLDSTTSPRLKKSASAPALVDDPASAIRPRFATS